ncbi:MAG: hypothetical protein C5B53_08780 [Candidatus Melainabacteria bacterium]|nr:MAG: hypothetical protein C5B53_08780 [Candidatus Melainabacteria bacterium]
MKGLMTGKRHCQDSAAGGLIFPLAIIMLVFVFPGLPTQSAERRALSAPELSALISNGTSGVTSTNVRVTSIGPLVTVLADKDANADDRDLKIEAMFIAKALIQGAPAQTETVKVIFFQQGKEGRFITISKQSVADYGAGRMSADKLLSSLVLNTVTPEKAPNVLPGEQYERRLLAWERIEKLKKQGTGVVRFEEIFRGIEDMIKAGNSEEALQKLTFLETKLSDQEELLKQAKNSQRGLGVPAVRNVQGQTSGRSASFTGSNVAPNQQPTFIPPDADRLEQTFKQQSNELINQVSAKDSSTGQRLRVLKQQIEQNLSSGNRPQAFALIHQFHTAVQSAIGTDPFAPPGGPQGGGMPPGAGNGGPMRPGGGEGPPDQF